MTANTILFDNVVAEVQQIVNRPDVPELVEQAVVSATRRIHSRATFPRDVVTGVSQLATQVYLASFDTSTLFTRFRAPSTVRLLDSTFLPVTKPEVELVELRDIYDPEYRTLKDNIAYLSGTALNVRSSYGLYGILCEYFQMPVCARTGYSSWIAALFPDPIVHQAAASIFAATGNAEKKKAFKDELEMEIFPTLIENYGGSILR